MRAVVQRVSRAAVTIGGDVAGSIGPGLVALVGIRRGDDEAAGRWLCDKLLRLRVFEDAQGKMNRTVSEAGGGILLVSQFTLYGDVRKGNRPGFDEAAPPEEATPHRRQTATAPASRNVSGCFGGNSAVAKRRQLNLRPHCAARPKEHIAPRGAQQCHGPAPVCVNVT